MLFLKMFRRCKKPEEDRLFTAVDNLNSTLIQLINKVTTLEEALKSLVEDMNNSNIRSLAVPAESLGEKKPKESADSTAVNGVNSFDAMLDSLKPRKDDD